MIRDLIGLCYSMLPGTTKILHTYVYPYSTKNFITNKIKIIFLKSNDKMSGKKVLRLGSTIKIVFFKIKIKNLLKYEEKNN